MKYTITYTCEHNGEVNIVGPEKDRPGKRQWLAGQLCPACKRAQQNEQIVAQAKDLGLVELTGSEKQVNWAKSLRQEFVTEFERLLSKTQDEEGKKRARNIFTGILNQHSDARFWIDHRGEGVRIFAKEWEAAYAK